MTLFAGPVAYVTGEYPKVSHTFIQREVETLREMGIQVIACTVRRPPEKTVVGPGQRAEAARTFGIIEAAKNPSRLLAAHGRMIARNPAAYLRAWALAWKTRPPGLKAVLWQGFYALEAGVLADHLIAQGAVHMHNHFGDSSGSLTMIASEMSGIPYSIMLHGPTVFFETHLWRLDEKIARAAFVACISHFCRSQAMLFSAPKHWGKLKIVHCGLKPEAYQALRRPFSGHIAFVGRLDQVKGVPLLIEAFGRLRARHPQARLTIAGDGPDRALLEQMAAPFGDAVTFPGYIDEPGVAALLGQADMLVLPSFAEGLPVVLMEAFASGIPVVATQVAGVPELVQDGISGFIVPPGDVETLTARIDRLLSEPGLGAQMGARGRVTVAAEHDIAHEMTWLAQCFAGQATGLRPALSPSPSEVTP